MTLLVTRQQMLDDLFAESRNQLLEVSKDKTRYEKFLADSLVQVCSISFGFVSHSSSFFCAAA